LFEPIAPLRYDHGPRSTGRKHWFCFNKPTAYLCQFRRRKAKLTLFAVFYSGSRAWMPPGTPPRCRQRRTIVLDRGRPAKSINRMQTDHVPQTATQKYYVQANSCAFFPPRSPAWQQRASHGVWRLRSRLRLIARGRNPNGCGRAIPAGAAFAANIPTAWHKTRYTVKGKNPPGPGCRHDGWAVRAPDDRLIPHPH